ncbi:agmatine deiminase family protein [Maridesulfovibrio sp.]|uniref:agmatine deiminase family protein n=1 Tax=Maridesulfovibrio sp. TaxID=2795000 RepID=UPI002AA7ED42|nr:agmatine deiminase family protein [Maridesulfovibrio sp.]
MKRNKWMCFGLLLFIPCMFGCWNNVSASELRNQDVNEKAVQAADSFVLPGEFEAIESVWLAYPCYDNLAGRPISEVQGAMIKALAPNHYIDLLVQDEDDRAKAEQWVASLEIPEGKVRYHSVPHTDVWVRDMGPIFLSNRKGGLRVADFGFNEWSYSNPTDPDAMEDERVDRLVARDLKLPIVRSSLISEGGDRESNGRGTLLTTEAVELQRNPSMTKEQITDELKRVCNVRNVIWLKQGLADDDLTYYGPLPNGKLPVMTTGGHIDEYARFADPHTILLAEVSEAERDEDKVDAITYERMETNYNILSHAVDQDGQPFTIVRVPIAEPIEVTVTDKDPIYQKLAELEYVKGYTFKKGEPVTIVLAASYMNFLVANDVVLVPTYWKEGRSERMKEKDARVQQIFEKVFPNRRIVRINPENVNAGGGGIHCISQQMPKSR